MRPSQLLASQREKILAIAAAHGASNVRVFGSAAKGMDRDESDLDLLVDIQAGMTLFKFAGLQLDIEAALGVKVDLCTPEDLHPRIRERVLAEARLRGRRGAGSIGTRSPCARARAAGPARARGTAAAAQVARAGPQP